MSDSPEPKRPIDVAAIMAKMPTQSSLAWFDNEENFGFIVRFSEKDFGFGEIVLGVRKASGEPFFDPEAMTPAKCAALAARVVGTEVLDADKDTI
jgi:hypothetical protein